MQDVVCVSKKLETGWTPPHKNSDTNINMDLTTETNATKESSGGHQSGRNDSGFLSATNNTSFSEEDNINKIQQNGDSDNRSDCSSPDRKYYCPICETMLTSQHEFTLHIRSHNNDAEKQIPDKGFTCRICSKVLSSNSSLDRHVLVHSGERPFTCKYCGDTFTTNGNMHRHMRTHTFKNEYESDDSTDSSVSTGSKSIEFNNNKIDDKNENKRQLETSNDEYKKFRRKHSNDLTEQTAQKIKCPVCERDDFNSITTLEYHLEDNHPDYPAKCSQCNQIFKNNKILNLHRTTLHGTEENVKNYKNSVVGFKDLTFVDFSSEKFPHIARHECEKNLHKVSTGLKFQCEKCSRAFPCSSSLEIHQSHCCIGLDLCVSESSLNLSKNSNLSDREIRRADFFSRLDLQDNSTEENDKDSQPRGTNNLHPRFPQSIIKTIDNGKDLADIQSILSMTANGRLLHHLQSTADSSTSQQNNVDDLHQEKTEEEESQDIFAVEFRKMKLRGEFPCRLCTAVFPNLRALKGHNRAHLSSNNNGTYRCNMCPHSSVDKAALIRHMRTHNGDRPYECSLCNYAFTTKANCERHLRNRHAKTTRDDVKKSIIYHPSEDPTNDEVNKISAREETKKSNSTVTPLDINDIHSDKVANSNTTSIHNSDSSNHSAAAVPKQKNLNPLIPLTLQIQAWKSSLNLEKTPPKSILKMNDIIHNESLKEHRISNELSPYFQRQFNFTPNSLNTSTPQKPIPKIQVKDLETLKQQSDVDYSDDDECDDYRDDEEPMNLVLDLSKKKTESREEMPQTKSEEVPQDLTKKVSASSTFSMTDILTQQLIKNTPKIEQSSLYHTPFSFLRNGFPGLGGWAPFPAINPLLFQPPVLSQDPQEIKRLQRQLCGGGMINNFTETLAYQPLNNSNPGSMYNVNLPGDLKYSGSKYSSSNQIKIEDVQPLAINLDQTFTDIGKIQSPSSQVKSELMQSPNSVKMVIKNGVLMPKQKQRRYRTERPFSCEHCSARFTLRSNMERHIKQQHPQFWSQRQRSNIGNPGRKNHSVTNLKSSPDVNVPIYDTPKILDYKEIKDNHISDKIKYAILAQHLRANQNYKSSFETIKKEDDDNTLVIDEKEDRIDNNVTHNFKCRSLEEKQKQLSNLDSFLPSKNIKNEDVQDLVPVSRLLDNASQQPFKEYFIRDGEEQETEAVSEEDEEGLVASGSTSEANSGSDEKSESEHAAIQKPTKKKSAYSLAPNRVSCPYCSRKFPWTSSLRRHILTHTGQKPFKCSHCPLLFTTKSNCDRHLLRKHGNSATTINNDSTNSSNSNYLMRNVPERPFKCSNCPSSTFSTYSNLKKHISCKHGSQMDEKCQGYETSSEDEKQNQHDHKNDWDTQISHSKVPTSDCQTTQSNSDLPFKCHLCEGTFSERNECLDHIKSKHPPEYDLLISKNALDNNASTPEESNNQDDEENEIRGKFPDYSNRKVICAFCMRRFWSAEDLRRHMRTHTGERPFSCDICRRRFTLKHSMLRHRKKHNITFESENLYSDEDNNMHPSLDKLKSNATNKLCDKTDESDGNEGNDLISNLLGIQDKSIIEQVLTSSPDDAAKLLGVKNGSRD